MIGGGYWGRHFSSKAKVRWGFLTTPESAGSMAQRDNRRLDMHHPAAGATRRCPVQSSTPLGPDQVNVLLLSVTRDIILMRNSLRDPQNTSVLRYLTGT
jgi:hypothetical protein